MGAWGIRSLQSDEGLDVLDILENQYLAEHTAIKMEDMISVLKEEVMLGESFEQIDLLFDNTAIALAELYVGWFDTGKLDYDREDRTPVWSKVTEFTASQDAIGFLLRCLNDIRNEVPDEDGEREIVELWKDSDSWERWSSHLDMLILRLSEKSEVQ